VRAGTIFFRRRTNEQTPLADYALEINGEEVHAEPGRY
jgi:hypothetical protein